MWIDTLGLTCGFPKTRVENYRKNLGGKSGSIGKGCNIATSNYDIQVNGKLIKDSIDAISGQGSICGVADIPDLNNRLFQTTTLNHPRAFDSEVKILENIGREIDPSARGTVEIFSELPICKSCQGVIKQFEEMFPNVKVIIL